MGINLENDGFVDNIFIGSAKFVCETINVVTHLMEVCELAAWNFLWENTIGLNVFADVIKTEL